MEEKKKTIAIFGAGQAGAMALCWIPGKLDCLGFIDNNPEKQGSVFLNYPVLSLAEMLAKKPDVILVSVLNREAEAEIFVQVQNEKFCGILLTIREFQSIQDLRLAALRLLAREIRERKVGGSLAELGVYRGDFAKEMNRLFPDRTIYLFDTFQGFDKRDLAVESAISKDGKHRDFSDTSVEGVRSVLPCPDKAVFVKGYFPKSLDFFQKAEETPKPKTYALVSIDPDLYAPALAGLRYFWPKLSKGGAILIHDYTSCQFLGVRKAVKEFTDEYDICVTPLMDLHGTAVLRKE